MSGNGNGFSYKFFEKMVVKEFYYIYNKYNIRLYLEVNVTVTLTETVTVTAPEKLQIWCSKSVNFGFKIMVVP